ncbi:hypothetical protein FJZ26_01075, partial [Candidatus Parvarchaeota archaeon]|nr:hypothetical protein [Candidatus Parvarchaeota archaeon]
MQSLEAIFSLIVGLSFLSMLLAASPAGQRNDLYGVQLANDLAEVSLKSDMAADLKKYFADADQDAKQSLESALNFLSPSNSICLQIKDASAEIELENAVVGGCPEDFKNSFWAQRGLVLE